MTMIKRFMNTTLASFLWYSYRRVKNSVLCHMFSLRPIESQKVLFQSFSGSGYNDNPRAISEALHKMYPDYEIVWGISRDKMDTIRVPEYVRSVPYGSLKWYKELATSGCWVSNVLMPDGTFKRKSQKYIQTWHGDRGFKKAINDAMKGNGSYQKRNKYRRIVEPEILDLGVTGSTFGEDFFRSAIGYQGKLLKTGCPRNDVLLHPEESKSSEIKKSLSLPLDARIVLFAPTFRDEQVTGQNSVQSNDLNMTVTLTQLESNTGEKWIALIRQHPAYRNRATAEKYKNDSRVFDVTDYPDMADLLCITDFLITDYSSSPGDFALTGKNILLYQPDIDHYTETNRGLYFRIEDSPYIQVRNQEEINEYISHWKQFNPSRNDREILTFYHAYETGSSAEAVVTYIVNHEK